jgi:hypothetical protein
MLVVRNLKINLNHKLFKRMAKQTIKQKITETIEKRLSVIDMNKSLTKDDSMRSYYLAQVDALSSLLIEIESQLP